MNVFILDKDPVVSASYLVDDHVAFVTVGPNRPPIRSCKMAIEALQLLSCAHWFCVPDREEIMKGPRESWLAPYRPSHMNHPWAMAARFTTDAYRFVWEHAKAILIEHEFRSGKKMESVLEALVRLEEPPTRLTEGPWSIPVCRAGSDTVHVVSLDEAVDLYRKYYRHKIEKMPRYTRRETPGWA